MVSGESVMSFLDKLPEIFSFVKPKQNNEYFFALNIDAADVIGAVWGVENGRLKIIGTAKRGYSAQDNLIESANRVLDEALADFPIEPSKILFGVPHSWLQDDNLKPDSLKLLKQMVKELDVVPMAYVSIVASISHLLQKQQGVPTTAVLVGIGDPLKVSVVKAGKIVGTKEQKRTTNLPGDIEKALLSFTDVEVLPSKILLYGEDRLERYKEELLSFSWMAQLPFLHLPKIDQINDDIEIKALCLAGASEVDPEVRFSSAEDIPVYPAVATASKTGQLNGLEIELGPVADESIKQGAHPNSEDVFGHQHQPLPERDLIRSEPRSEHPRLYHEHGITKIGVLDKLIGFWHGSIGRLLNTAFLASKGALILLVVFVLLLVAAVLFMPKAKVTIFIDLRTLDRDTEVTADPGIIKVDEAGKKIPGKIVETTVTGSDKGSASGKKQIGDPAKGSVVVYNKTNAPKTFSQGTILVGPNNLTFALDASVSTASQSAVDGGISFGKATVNVTASSIGPDGNLPAGKELSIKELSSNSYSAKVDSAFSGGVSKDVSIVTSDDQKKLLASLASSLRQKAKDELQSKLTGDLKVLEEGLSESIIKTSYSKNINDQAQDFTLNLTVSYKGTAFSDKDLKSVIAKSVETNVPQGYSLDMSQAELQSNVSKIDKDGKLVFLSKFRVKLMPKFDVNKIKNQLKGKTPEQAGTILKKIDSVIGSNIELKPRLPKPLQFLPLLIQNITVETTTK